MVNPCVFQLVLWKCRLYAVESTGEIKEEDDGVIQSYDELVCQLGSIGGWR